MSNLGSSLLSDGPVELEQPFDPLALYDQIYPQWRTGPVLPVDPTTEPMPTDPALGSMSPEATSFPAGFADVTGMGGEMPPLADFSFGAHSDGLAAHDRTMAGLQNGTVPNFLAGGSSAPQTLDSAADASQVPPSLLNTTPTAQLIAAQGPFGGAGQGDVSDMVYRPGLGQPAPTSMPIANAPRNNPIVFQPLATQTQGNNAGPDANTMDPDNAVIATRQNAARQPAAAQTAQAADPAGATSIAGGSSFPPTASAPPDANGGSAASTASNLDPNNTQVVSGMHDPAVLYPDPRKDVINKNGKMISKLQAALDVKVTDDEAKTILDAAGGDPDTARKVEAIARIENAGSRDGGLSYTDTPNAKGKGPLQITEPTWNSYKDKLHLGPWSDADNLHDAAQVTAQYIRDVQKRYNKTDPAVVAADYIGGPAASQVVDRGGIIDEEKAPVSAQYVRMMRGLMRDMPERH